MINEQRALATLDLALKNAFETLHKYKLWATTPEDAVTFNLVDAVPTLDSSGSSIFLRPHTVPSFASIHSTIFGVASTEERRSLFWNIDFESIHGWTFRRRPGSTSTRLNVLVDTYFGDHVGSDSITISKTNVTEIFNGNSSIQFRPGNLVIDSRSFLVGQRVIGIGASGSVIDLVGRNISLGYGSGFSAFTYETTERGGFLHNNIVIGSVIDNNRFNYDTTISSSSLSIELSFGANFHVSMYDHLNTPRRLLGATYRNGAYDVDFIGHGFNPNRLTIGDTNELYVISNRKIDIRSASGHLLFSEGSNVLFGDTIKISSDTKTSISSKTSIGIGIEGNGVQHDEIVISKGRVSIPNLHVQKKSNYNLSGIKHLTHNIENPSVRYIPNRNGLTLTNASDSFEYTKNITGLLDINASSPLIATTINDRSGSPMSYMFVLDDDGIKVYSATVTGISGATTVEYQISSPYEEMTHIIGLSDVRIAANVPMRTINAVSTELGMYVIMSTRNAINNRDVLSVFYTQDCINFIRIKYFRMNNIMQLRDDRTNTIKNISIDASTIESKDHIWMSVTSELLRQSPDSNRDPDLRPPAGHESGTPLYTVRVLYIQHGCDQNNDIQSAVYTHIRGGISYQTVFGGGNGNPPLRLIAGLNPIIILPTPTSGNPRAAILMPFSAMRDGGHDSEHVVMVYEYTPSNTGRGLIQRVGLGSGLLGHGLSINHHDKIIDLIALGGVNGSDQVTIHAIETIPTGGNRSIYGPISFTISGYMGNLSSLSRPGNGYTRPHRNDTPSHITIGPFASYSRIIGFVNNQKYTLRAIVANNGQAMIQHGDNTYPGHILRGIDARSSMISSVNFMYFDTNIGVIRYNYNDPNGNAVQSSIGVRHINLTVDGYDIKGFISDYIGISTTRRSSNYDSFVLSDTNIDPYRITNTHTATDRATTVFSTNNDVFAIVHSSNTPFIPTPVSELLSIDYDVNSAILIEISDRYSSNGFFRDRVNNQSTDLELLGLYFHIECVSYIAKNRNMFSTGSNVAFGNYTIIKTSNSTYSIDHVDNRFSGYRVPYSTNSPYDPHVFTANWNQLVFSNMSVSVTDPSDMNVYKKVKYVTTFDSFLVVHDELALADSTVFVRIPYRRIDPLDPHYDPSNGIINEFNNVVSIKTPYIFGFRSGLCGDGIRQCRSSIIFGLTEISEIGSDC